MRTVRILILAAVATAVLTGCRSSATPSPAASGPTPPTPTAVSTGDNGIYALPANEIAARAADAVDTNSFVRMKTTPGNAGADTVELLKLNNVEGQCVVTRGADQIELIRLGKYEYIKADTSYWIALGLSQAEAERASGKYVRAPMGTGAMPCVSMPNIIWELLIGDVTGPPTVTKGKPALVNGVPTIAITVSGEHTMWVALTGEPYVLRYDDGKDHGVDLFDYKVPASFPEPPADQIIDRTTLRT